MHIRHHQPPPRRFHLRRQHPAPLNLARQRLVHHLAHRQLAQNQITMPRQLAHHAIDLPHRMRKRRLRQQLLRLAVKTIAQPTKINLLQTHHIKIADKPRNIRQHLPLRRAGQHLPMQPQRVAQIAGGRNRRLNVVTQNPHHAHQLNERPTIPAAPCSLP